MPHWVSARCLLAIQFMFYQIYWYFFLQKTLSFILIHTWFVKKAWFALQIRPILNLNMNFLLILPLAQEVLDWWQLIGGYFTCWFYCISLIALLCQLSALWPFWFSALQGLLYSSIVLTYLHKLPWLLISASLSLLYLRHTKTTLLKPSQGKARDICPRKHN